MTVAVVVIVWVLIGLAIGAVMIRKGHSPAIWLSLAAYGPLALLLALSAADTEQDAPPIVRAAGEAGAGPVDVLVGVDGSPESAVAAAGVPAMLGDRLGRLCLATVVDYDARQLPGHALPNEQAAERLDEEAARLAAATGRSPATVVLTGRPADALRRYARDEGYDAVAVGRRGTGASRLVLGSAASALAAHTDLPVLLFGAPTPEPESAPDAAAT